MPRLEPQRSLNPASNRTRKKSKKGCKTCKLRKIKCDETSPVCINCRKYYSNTTPQCEYGPGEFTNANASDGGSSSSGDTPATIHFRRSKSSRHQVQLFRRTSPSLPIVLGGHKLDPFDTQHETKVPGLDRLHHYYLTTTREKCVPVGFKPENNPLATLWWPLIQGDSFLNYVACQVAAVDIECALGRPNSYGSNEYSKEGLRLLREKLEDPVAGIADETIAAVASLAVIEHSKRNMTAAKMHVEGVKRMVSLRGGLDMVRASSPITASTTFWFTFLIMSEQQFPVLEKEHVGDYSPHLNCFTSNEIRFEDFVDDEASLRALTEARRFCYDLTLAAKDNSLPMPGVNGIHSRNGYLLQRLLVKAPPGTSRPPLTECCRFAAAIFLFFGFENHFPDPTLIINTLLHKLKDALSNVLPCPEEANAMVIWLLAVGGAAASKLPAERDWFIGYMIDTAASLELHAWGQMREALRRIMWIDAMNDSPFRELWEDAMLIAKSQITQDPFYTIHRLA